MGWVNVPADNDQSFIFTNAILFTGTMVNRGFFCSCVCRLIPLLVGLATEYGGGGMNFLNVNGKVLYRNTYDFQNIRVNSNRYLGKICLHPRHHRQNQTGFNPQVPQITENS